MIGIVFLNVKADTRAWDIYLYPIKIRPERGIHKSNVS